MIIVLVRFDGCLYSNMLKAKCVKLTTFRLRTVR